jgi:hypothetical protein
MKKILIFCILTVGIINTISAGKLNRGFLMNQRYVCINQGMLVNKKLIPVMSQEEALRHPIRIMIDSDEKLQTDGPMKNLEPIGGNTYTDGTNKMKLFVEDDKLFMFLSSTITKNIPILHVCVETDNWTIVK